MPAWRLARRADTELGRIAWDRFGDGPPVVLVHGTPNWSFLWRNVVPVLSGELSVYVLDLAGYGDSDRFEGQDMSITAQGRLLAELIAGWGLAEPGLVGHDIGGATVLRAHLLEGAPASRIALVDAVALNPWNTPATQHIRKHLDAYRTMPAHIYEQVVAAHLQTAVHRELEPETLASYLAPWQGEDGQAAYFRKIEQWTDDDVGALRPLLGEIGIPVRLLWGEDDRWLDRAVAERLRAALPGAELRLVPAAGHFAPEDQPERVAGELLDFLSPGD